MPGSAAAPIQLANVNHFFGAGALRKQILHGISVELRAGEIVIVTGPSGSGKTTLLTLIGALRSAQEGSVRVLGEELRGANARTLERVRRDIGYIFQAHNLLDALSATQNVMLSLLLDRVSARDAKKRAHEWLEAVGLGERRDHHPSQLSGGQRQRVAIARALAGAPRIVLADEPTASLDKQSGREVVDLMQDLARKQGVTVLLVTHDNRILDVADRIVHLEDGRLSGFTEHVTANTQHMMDMLARNNRRGDLQRRVAEAPAESLPALLEQATQSAREFLRVTELSQDDAFQSMFEEALAAFTLRFGDLLDAERASIFLLDAARRELVLRVAQAENGRRVDVRMPIANGVAGHVAATGESLRVDDAYASPLFNPEVDRATGFTTRSILCVPILDGRGAVFAVAQLLNKRGGAPFDASDEARFREFARGVAPILEGWARMGAASEARRTEARGESTAAF
ncbi:MAG TPA: ATP-binding cassette domain-containing protein [Myxococcota bacterium]|jgi:putative ABC transport system ATP-binding protein